ncbi:MAG TPA: 2-oxo acid dehydrogenase subunit E2 [Steroidobacteraceae bacterium]|nr:2-oxo acid dehydrogenase subunit E2 [Steroidobacteraceae bacterium]
MSSVADVLAPLNADGTRATILRWCKSVGDAVVKDEPLLELETDKVTVEIPAPADGTLIEILKQVNAEVSPDEVLARLSLLGESASSPRATATATAATSSASTPRELQAPAGSGDAHSLLSPAVRRLLREHSIDAAELAGTGLNGRITAHDVERYAAAQKPIADDTRVPHSAIRRRVAEHMVRSVAAAPHVTTLFEADLTRVLAHRARNTAAYQSRGVHLTLTAYFVSACATALQTHREVNATFHREALELHRDINIGVGTALGEQGLIVPVIHRAQSLDLFELAQRLERLVAAARAGKLAAKDVRGGTFTISNHGVGGSLLAAPIIINQPQVAILGVGKVQRRVCVLPVGNDEEIGIRPMCYLTLTIDHRALDAFQANAFLGSIVATLEQWPEAD